MDKKFSSIFWGFVRQNHIIDFSSFLIAEGYIGFSACNQLLKAIQTGKFNFSFTLEDILFQAIAFMALGQAINDKGINEIFIKLNNHLDIIGSELEKIRSQQPSADKFFSGIINPSEVNNLIRSSNVIKMFGINLKDSILGYSQLLEERVKNGANVQAIVMSPINRNLHVASLRSNGETAQDLKDNYNYSMRKLKEIKDTTNNSDLVEVKIVDMVPSFALVMLDNGSSSRCLVKFYAHRKTKENCFPVFWVSPKQELFWYEYFQDQYNIIWNSKDPFVHNLEWDKIQY
jgi:hypothetical protein